MVAGCSCTDAVARHTARAQPMVDACVGKNTTHGQLRAPNAGNATVIGLPQKADVSHEKRVRKAQRITPRKTWAIVGTAKDTGNCVNTWQNVVSSRRTLRSKTHATTCESRLKEGKRRHPKTNPTSCNHRLVSTSGNRSSSSRTAL